MWRVERSQERWKVLRTQMATFPRGPAPELRTHTSYISQCRAHDQRLQAKPLLSVEDCKMVLSTVVSEEVSAHSVTSMTIVC
jgi:hypothetical protein